MAESEEVERLLNDIAALEQIEDDEACARAVTELLKELPEQQARLRELRQARVHRMRERGLTWKQIGDSMGVHFTRARQIAEGQRGEKNRPAKKDRPAESE